MKENIGGPLLDRIDMHIEVPAVPFDELSGRAPGTSSASMREEVKRAKQMQAARFQETSSRANAHMSSREVRQHCVLDKTSRELLRNSVDDLGLSARAHDKILRVARTIADLEELESVQQHHLQEAINYRLLDRDIWV